MKKNKIKIIVSLLISLLLFSSSVFAEEKNLHLTTWCGPPFSNTEGTGYLDQILKEAFSRMNLNITIQRKPAERSLYDANKGLADGEFIRVEKIGQLYPNLVIVPEHLFEMEFSAFTKRDDVKIDNDWKSLEQYSVGIVRGWKILEENVIYTKGRRNDVSHQENMFKMLDAGRMDVAVYSKQFGLEVIRLLGLKGIRIVEPPLAKKEMYLFLHKRHEDIVPNLSNILKAMKEDGSFEKIREKTLLTK